MEKETSNEERWICKREVKVRERLMERGKKISISRIEGEKRRNELVEVVERIGTDGEERKD